MATERVQIIVEERGSRIVQRRLTDVGDTADRSARRVNLLRSALLAIGGVAVLRNAVRTIAEFEQALSTVRAVSSATEEQFVRLRDAAADLGATTRFTATQAAEGLVFLARAGFTVEEQLNAIGGTLRLAQAGALDLGRAADIASNVLRGFRLEAVETGRAVDVLALAANSSNTNVEQLGDALKFVAPVASGLGVQLEEATAAVGALSDAGLQASLAGTGLRRVLSELESPSAKTIRILKTLGLSASDVRISQVGLTNALIALRDAGLSTGEALEVFGDRGGPAFEVLSSSIPQVQRLTESLRNADGTAERIAQTMDDNLNGAILAVKSAVEAVILQFGQLGSSFVLTQFLKQLAEGFRFLARNIEIVAGLVTGLAALAIPRLIAGIKLLTVAIATNPVGLLIVGLGTAVGALVAFRDQITLTSDGLVSLGDFLRAASQVLGETLPIVLANAASAFAPLIEAVTGFRVESQITFTDILRIGAGFVDGFAGLFVGLGAALVLSFESPLRTLRALFTTGLNAIIEVLEFFSDAVTSVFFGIGRSFRELGLRLKSALTLIQGAVTQLRFGNFDQAGQFIEDAIFQISQGTKDLVTGFGDNIAQEFDRLRGQDVLKRIEGPLVDDARNLGEAIGSAISNGISSTTGATDLVESILERTELLSSQRRAEEELKAIRAAAGTEGAAGTTGPTSEETELNRRRLALAQINAEFARESELLALSNREREISVRLRQVEESLLERNIALTEEEVAGVEARLRLIQALGEQAELYEQIRGPQEAFIAQQTALNELFAQGRISVDEYKTALRELQLVALDSATDVSSGFERGFLSVTETITDFASLSERTIVNAFSSAEDALAEFVQTGEFNFSKLVDSILADLARLFARQALSGLLGALTGGAAGFGGGVGSFLFGGGRAAGGPVDPGKSFLVGEQGPEMFVPSVPGKIVPSEQTAAMMGQQQEPPQVNVQVVNVTDPNEVASALNEQGVQDQIINVLRRNRTAVRTALGV